MSLPSGARGNGNGASWNRLLAGKILRAAVWLSILVTVPARMPAQQSGQAGAPSGAPSPQGQRSNSTADGAARPEGSAGPKANLINESQLVGLPLNGRSYSQLATLEAGVSDPSAASASRGTGGGSLNVSGGRASSNSFLLDGTNIMDTGNRSPRSAAGVQLGTDSVLQVLVFSTTYTAEYGRGSGGVLNSITRSGSNDFHGSLFEYLRNSALDARNWVNRGPGPDPFRRNQFGFTLTGPVRKDKTYFMGSFEALIDRLTESQLDTFIDSNARNGIITDASGIVLRTVDVNPFVKPYLNLMPLPNQEFFGGRLGDGLAQNVSPQYLPTDEKFFTVRIDHAISERDSLFGRYSFDDATSNRAGGIFAFGTKVRSRQQYATLVGSHIFNTRLLTAFRLGYTRPVDATESTSVIPIPTSLYFVKDAPQFGVLNIPGVVGFGPTGTAPESNKMNSFQFSGDVLAQRGPHGLKFGIEVNRYRWDVSSSSNKSANWSFNSLDSFLQRGPVGTSVTVALPGSDNTKAWRQTLVGFYAQDEYKFRPNLQLSLGFRYEFATLIHDRLGRTSHLDDLVHGTQMIVGPLLDHNPSLGNLSPRLGLAWSPGGSRNTSVNAGFGIYYDQLLGYALDTTKNMAPFYGIGINPTFDASTTFPDALAAVALAAGSFPQQAQILDYQNFTSTRVMRYELSIQHRLPKQTNVQAAYVGARGNHLWRNYEANLFAAPITRTDGSYFFPAGLDPINPAFKSGINIMASDAQSFYNSFLLTADTRLSRALSLRASFTFSKTIDDASSIGTSASAQQYGPDRKLDRGLSDFDNRQRLSTSFFYTLPAIRGRNGLLSDALQLFGGWRVNGIFGIRTSVPTTARMNFRRSDYLLSATRPDLLSGQSNNPRGPASIGCYDLNPATGQPIVDRVTGQPVVFLEPGTKVGGPDLFYDPCVFLPPAAGSVGNLGRATLFGPSIVNMDISLQRDFSLGGDRRLQFRGEIFNVANHTNFRTPTASSMVVFSGRGFNRGLGKYVNTSTTSRQIQFALRFSF